MSRIRALGCRYGSRDSAAVACICGAEIVAPKPMICGLSWYGAAGA